MTGTACCVATCKSNAIKAKRTGEKIMFFRFPKDASTRKQWIKRCYRKDKFNPENQRMCSKHFTVDDFEDRLQATLMNYHPKKLEKTAIPSLHLLPSVLPEENDSAGTKITVKKERRDSIELLLSTTVTSSQSMQSDASTSCSITNSVTDTVPGTDSDDPLEIVQKHEDALQENVVLKRKLEEVQQALVDTNRRNLELQDLLKANEAHFEDRVANLFCNFLTRNQIEKLMKIKI